MKTKHVPALVMLIAGAVAAVLMMVWHLDFFQFTRNLLIVLIIFYVLGCVIKVILDRNFPVMEDEEEENPEGEETEESAEGEESADGEVTENVDTEENEEQLSGEAEEEEEEEQ